MPAPELLSPAGNLAALKAALSNGADAVYLGPSSFGARSAAAFSDQDLAEALKTAHLYGKRVYVTVNTLVKEQEVSRLRALLRLVDSLRADAVIVQDIGVLSLAREEFPELPVHASTQMGVHNASGADFLRGLGVSRVVAARECSLKTLSSIAATGMETEVFVHGAMCASVSGQCQMSALIGGRSGNRGSCAQPCRLQYLYRGVPGAWLSPRDLCAIELLPALIAAGVASFKIEGRLKRPEYVAVVTAAYRRAIDRAAAGESCARPEDLQALLQVFNRGGFTKGYAGGQGDADIINEKRVSHDGLPIGRIISCRTIGASFLSALSLLSALKNGDGLQIRGAAEQDMVYSGPDRMPGEQALIRHRWAADPGDQVFRLDDEDQLSRARRSFEACPSPVMLDAVLMAAPGRDSTLTFSDGTVSAGAQGDPAAPARSAPLTMENALSCIRKTGGTPYALRSLRFVSDVPVFLPLSSLNSLRREALEAFGAAKAAAYRRRQAPPWTAPAKSVPVSADAPPQLYVRSAEIGKLDGFVQAGADVFLYAPMDYTGLERSCAALRRQDALCLPRQCTDATLRMLWKTAVAFGLRVVAENIGQLNFSWPRDIIGGEGLPVWNARAALFLSQSGCSSAVLSRESSRQEVEALVNGGLPVRLILPAYGRAEVMFLNHCPERVLRGLHGLRDVCSLCREGKGTRGGSVADRLGCVYPLSPIRLPEGCLNVLLHHSPRHLSGSAPGMSLLLHFTTEDSESSLRLTRHYAALMKKEAVPADVCVPMYKGRFGKGVS